MALFAPSAGARPWEVEAVPSRGAAFSRAVDVLPSGRTAVLIQRRAGAANRLELRLAGRTRVLDSAAGGFLDTDLQHDRRGRLVATWRRALEGGTIQAFAWAQGEGAQQLSSGAQSVSHLSLAAAPSGRAAVAYWSGDGVFVARRAPGRRFGKPAGVAAAGTYEERPGVGVARRGRVVVAWTDGRRVLARAANGSQPFGSVQAVALREAKGGNTLVPGAPEVAVTSNGRAVVTVSSEELRGSPPAVADRRVEAFDWPSAAARPSAAATLSRGAGAGVADVTAVGRSALIAWTQRPAGAPRALWATRWTPRGLQRPNVYDTRALGPPVLLARAPRGAVDVFYRASGARWFTVRLSAAGRYSGTSVVTPPNDRVPLIDVASAGRHAAAAWSVRLGRSGRSARVRIAQPAG